ncbi:hypothetical protein SFRURICE_008847, partial [Spodoptera frugiperda]
LCYEDVITKLRSCARKMRSSNMRYYYIDSRGTTHIFPYNPQLCVPKNMIAGNQTHPQRHSIAHFRWKNTLMFSPRLFSCKLHRP